MLSLQLVKIFVHVQTKHPTSQVLHYILFLSFFIPVVIRCLFLLSLPILVLGYFITKKSTRSFSGAKVLLFFEIRIVLPTSLWKGYISYSIDITLLLHVYSLNIRLCAIWYSISIRIFENHIRLIFDYIIILTLHWHIL